jgi:hypothetical protein
MLRGEEEYTREVQRIDDRFILPYSAAKPQTSALAP